MPETKTIKDLPIYGDLFDNKSQALWITIESKEKGQLEKFVTSFRQGVCDFMQQFKHQKNLLLNIIKTPKMRSRNKQITLATRLMFFPS